MRMPRSGRAPLASTRARTPRRSRMRPPSGERYSPQILSRGNRARSRRTTESLCRASRMAVAVPAGPAPTTTASARTGRSFDRARPDADLAERGRPLPPKLRQSGARREAGQLRRRVRPSHREWSVVTGHAAAPGGARHEPDGGPGEPAPTEIADHEAQANDRSELAQQSDDRVL